jgi:hypothetical protein
VNTINKNGRVNATENEDQYECDSCGKMSDEARNCCGQPMKKRGEEE